MSATIYYFSGTGNSYKIAKKICDGLENSTLINIAKEQIPNHDNTNGTIGIVFPLYYFGIPIIVEEFLLQLKIPENAYVFVIVTRGEPMAGGAKRQLDTAFNASGRTYQFFRYVTMGNNYPFHVFNGSKEKVKEQRNKKAGGKVLTFLADIKTKKQSRIFSILDYPPFPSITYNFPTYGYKHFLQVYNKDTCFEVDEALCNKCKKCKHSCPTDNVEINSKVEWKHSNCQMCLACYNCCPKNAIQYIDINNKVDTNGKRQYWNVTLGESPEELLGRS